MQLTPFRFVDYLNQSIWLVHARQLSQMHSIAHGIVDTASVLLVSLWLLHRIEPTVKYGIIVGFKTLPTFICRSACGKNSKWSASTI